MLGIRTILAIVIGGAVTVAIILGGTAFLRNNNPAIDTSTSGRLVLLGVACFGGLAGGFMAATIAAKRRRLHAILLGLLLCAFGIVQHMFFPDTGSAHDPTWFSFGLPILAFITATAGGMLRSRS